MDRPRVVGLGMAALDILLRARSLPTWDSGTRLDAVAVEGGGPAATAMVAVQRLGVRAGFVGTYGADRLGQIKLQTLVENGVDVSHAVGVDGPEDQVVLVCVNSESGERIFSGVGGGLRQSLKVEDLSREYVTSADFLHLDGMHAAAALQAAIWMREAGKRVMLDGSATRGPVSDGLRALVGLADVVIAGAGFCPALTGRTEVRDAGSAVLDLGPRVVVQTLGREGSYTVTPTGWFHVPAFDVTVVDTTGAGDVFHGAYLVAMALGWDTRTAALFSTAVAAIKCTQLSGRRGIPTFAQTIEFLRVRGIDLPQGDEQNASSDDYR